VRTLALQYLETHHTMTLATDGPEGLWAASLFYVNDDFVLYWLSNPTSRHSRNIAHNPRVAITVHEDYRDWREIQGLQMEGTAEQLGAIHEAVAPMRRYGAKYPFLRVWRDLPPPLVDALTRARVYRFAPRRVFFTDNTRSFGHREEITL